jgi:hypothetical protein
VEHVTALVEELTAQRAEDRIGDLVSVLVESVDEDGVAEGRAEHQGPEVDGVTTLTTPDARPLAVGNLVPAVVVASVGVDLVAEVTP